MKQETSKKSKKWIWLVAGAVVLLAIVGVALAFLLPGGQPEGPTGGRADLYWNVDRLAYQDKESGLSAREPAEDGLFHVRFALNGEHVEYTVSDKRLINYIDTQEVMGLKFDDSGMVIDAVAAVDLATEVGRPLYVQEAAGNTIMANTSPSMNGLSMELAVTEQTQIYDVSSKAEFVGGISDVASVKKMDRIYVYANDLEEITHIYIVKHAVQSPVYWRTEQFYSSSKKETTREPDENGYYSIDFFCEGEKVTLKCNKKDVVSAIDSRSVYSAHTGLELDSDGNIIDTVGSGEGIGGLLLCERYWITSFNGNTYTAEKPGTSDAPHSFAVPSTAKIYDVGKAAMVEGRQGKQVDYLNEGDRVCVWTDTNGVVVLIYVSNSVVDVPVFFNPDRQYDSKTLGTAREPDYQGYYNFELYEDGATGLKTYKTKDKAIADYLDSIASRIVGVVANDNIIERVYDPEAVFGNTHYTYGRYVNDIVGPIISCILVGQPLNANTAVLSTSCEVYNVSGYGEYGLTTLQAGDCIYAMKDPLGEVVRIYVLRRYMGEDYLYFILDSKYDTEKKTTKREPDEDGWYRILTAHNGKQVTLRTRSKAMVEKVESIDSVGAAALIVSGDVIIDAHPPQNATGGSKVSSGYRIKSFNDDGTITTYYKTRESTFRLADDCVYYNVSTHTYSHKGERTSYLNYGDMLTVFTNWRGEAKVVYVRNRVSDKVGIKTEALYDATNKVTLREPDADGWYYVDIASDGEVKTYKTKNKELMSNIDSYGAAFGFSADGDVLTGFSSMSYAKGAAGNGVSNYDVMAVDGNKITLKYNVPGSSNTGTTKTIYLSYNAKVYDISPNAETFGMKAQLREGDRIRTYLSNAGNETHAYVYILYRDTQVVKEAFCEHCDQLVSWSPWFYGSGVTLQEDGHYYLSCDIKNVGSQIRIGAADVATPDVVLDLQGYSIQATKRAFAVYPGSSLSIMDTVGGGEIHGAQVDKNQNGGVIRVDHNSTFTLYSGSVIDAATVPHLGHGGAISTEGGTINIFGGTVSGGTTKFGGTLYVSKSAAALGNIPGNLNISGGVINGGIATSEEASPCGGAIYVSNANFTMTGGKVTGGQAISEAKTTTGGNIYLSANKNYSFHISGGVIEDGIASNGGNIYIANGNLTVSGDALITRGVSHRPVSNNNGGGNVFLQKATSLTMEGGSITDGVATSYGGNVVCRGGVFTFNGGVISGGVSETGYGNNVFINGSGTEAKPDSDAKLIASGGQIVNGDVYVREPNSEAEVRLVLSNIPVIEQLRLDAGALAELYELTDGADVSVVASGVFTVPYEHAEAYVNAGYIKPHASAAGVIRVENNTLSVVNANYCAHCGQEVEWLKWKHQNGGETSTMKEDGHYYLEEDILGITSQIRIGLSDGSVAPHIVLDLNGHTMKSVQRVFAVYPNATLSIIDSVGGGEIQGAQIAKNQNGGVIRVDGGSTLNLYSGTITDIATEAHFGYGGAISTEGGTINIYGGTVNGGTSQYGGALYISKAANASGGMAGNLNISGGVINGGVAAHESENPFGGAIAVINGNFTMTGGKVIGGQAVSETKTPGGGNIYLSGNNTYKFEITGGTIEGGIASNGNGGNIYIANGTLTIGGDAVIIGGTADRSSARTNGGGNIYGQVSTTLNINGGTIADGVSVNSYGGNVMTRGTLNMTDGVISGGTATNGGNVFINGYDNERVFTMTGGTIENGTATIGDIDRTNMVKPAYNGDNVYINSATMVISGGVITDNNGGNAILAYTAKTAVPAVVKLTAGENAELIAALDSKIYLIKGAQIFADKGGTNADTDGDLIWVIEGYGAEAPSLPTEPSVEPTEPSVEPTEPSTTPTEPTAPIDPNTKCPHCGVKMSEIDWIEWTAGGHLSTSGHYYLSGDVAPSGQRAVGQNSKVDVVVDLRGRTYLPAEGRRTFTVYSDSTLTILDTVGGGQVIGRYTSDVGATINFDAGTVNLYGGTFSTTNTENTQNGGVIGVGENGTLNVYEGATIIGGPAKFGGAIYAKGNVNVYGGLIQGGVASSESTNPVGGAIAVINGNFVMTGGKVTGGTAITEGKSSSGGNIYLSGNASNTFKISGGIIENGVASNGNGGNIYLNNGTLTISGDAQILGGSAQRMLARNNGGGNIYVQATATLNIEGGLIADGVSVDSFGGNVLSRGNVNMSGGVISGGSALNGGNLFINGYVADLRVFTMTGGEIKDGTATTGKIDRTNMVKPAYDGDNVYVNSAIMNISGGMITDNDGGNAILAYTAKAEFPTTVNMTLANAADLAAALDGKVYIISGATLNTDLGTTIVDSDKDAIWYCDPSTTVPTEPGTEPTEPSTEATEPSTEATEPSTEATEPTTEPTEPEKPENEGVCPCHGLTVTQIDEITKANPTDAKAWVDFDGTALADGVHYRLNSDLTLTPSATSAVIMVEGEKSMLNLNGHNITVFIKGVSRRLVHMAENCQLTICGNGEISGNGNGGGVVYMKAGSVFNLYDATLTNSKVGGTARGGVIVTEKPASGETATYINMYSGTMNAGAHSGDGGCISLSAYGQLNMYGGTLNGTTNEIGKKGGALYTTASTCKVNIYGGTINGGKNTGDGSAVCMYSSPSLKIEGGTINGTVHIGSATAGAVQLSGAPVIEDLRLVSGASIALGEGGITGGSIGVTAEAGAICVTSEAAVKSAEFFTSNVAGLKIVVDEYDQICLSAEAQSVSNLTKSVIVGGLKGKMLTR